MLLGPFPETNSGNRYILVIKHYFSKWPEAFAIPNQEATTVADCLINHWVSRFGVPLELHSDLGRNFESQVYQEVCSVLWIKKTRTTPLHPQSDGMVERFNRTLHEHPRKVVDDHQREWNKHIPLFLLAYRSSTHNSTGQSPALIIFGKEMRLPSELRFGS
ncbi:protein NYNRIN-like [Diaphorina citri]|uniref:Protein NYNRIN-like n=1 Tax=Diaphorina citri TaxID=121845 RepID=A0A1S4E9I7_DIACI|nr:protein NYNRIN-like [Diaphorina citri]